MKSPAEMTPAEFLAAAIRQARLNGHVRTFGDEVWVMVTGPREAKAPTELSKARAS